MLPTLSVLSKISPKMTYFHLLDSVFMRIFFKS